MKKILFVIPSLEVGGTVSSLSCIVEYLQNDYKIKVLSLTYDGNDNVSFKKQLLKSNIWVHSYYCNFTKIKNYKQGVVILVKILKRICSLLRINLEKSLTKLVFKNYQEFDYVVAFQEGAATKFVSYIPHIPKIAWVHCDYQKYPNSGQEKDIYNNFSKIVCVSQFTSSTFKSVYPIFQSRVQCIYNLLNIDQIVMQSKCPIADSHFINNTFTIISVGRVTGVKQFKYIPEFARQLIDRGCKFKWYIIGPSTQESCLQELLDKIDEYNVNENVVYLGNKSNPYPYFTNSQLLVSLSASEACPMVFNEAKILGLPIVTTDFGSSYEFIKNGEYGVIASLYMIVDVIEALILEPSYYNQLKQKMLNLSYSNDTILLSLVKLFR